MNDPITQALMRLVEQSSTPDEMSRRVIQSFGEAKLARARQIAAETKGFEWLRLGQTDQPPSPQLKALPQAKEAIEVLLRAPSLLALLAGAVMLLLVILCPPFIVPLPQGLVSNAGFAFILNPPTQGSLTAIVNTPLLALLALGVMAVTAGFYVPLAKLERLISARERP